MTHQKSGTTETVKCIFNILFHEYPKTYEVVDLVDEWIRELLHY